MSEILGAKLRSQIVSGSPPTAVSVDSDVNYRATIKRINANTDAVLSTHVSSATTSTSVCQPAEPLSTSSIPIRIEMSMVRIENGQESDLTPLADSANSITVVNDIWARLDVPLQGSSLNPPFYENTATCPSPSSSDVAVRFEV